MPFYEFEGHRPEIGDQAFIHPQAVLIGRVFVGRGCFIGAGAVLRGDFGEIFVGDGSNVQENAVLHATPIRPARLEEDVIFAHSALLHDSTVRRGAMVGMGAIILHGALVEEDAVVAAGALVPPGYTVPSRKIVAGNPARVIKEVSDEALAMNRIGLAEYQEMARRHLAGLKRLPD